jgi:hypothetical protein
MSNEITAFQAMQTDIQISMDDVVSAFVSKYETNLYTRKKELGAAIKNVETRTAELVKLVRSKVNGKSFKTTLPFDLEMKVDDGNIDWHSGHISFDIVIAKKNSGSYYRNEITVNKKKPIPAAQVKLHEKLETEAVGLRSDLAEVLVALKSITRKEREVRGRIAIRKLEDSGYADLMNDSELAKLVQLDDA